MPHTFGELLSLLKSCKSLYIVYSPNIDSLHSTFLLYRVLKEHEIDIQLAPFYRASKPIESGVTVLMIGVFQRTPLANYRILYLDDYIGRDPKTSLSISLHIVKELKNYWIIPRTLEVLSLAAMLSLSRYSLYDEKLFEAHRNLVETAISKEFWEYVNTLRLFGYPKIDLATSLEKTIDPYILGYSLDSENSKKFQVAIGEVTGVDIRNKINEEITKILSTYSRNPISIIGNKIIVRGVDDIDDIYEATYFLQTFIDLKGPDTLIYLYTNLEFFKYIKIYSSSVIKRIKNFIDETIRNQLIKRVIIRGNRVSVIDISIEQYPLPLYTVYRIFRALGLVDEIAVFSHGKEYLLPIQFIEPRWPLDRELNMDRHNIVLSSLQEIGDVIR